MVDLTHFQRYSGFPLWKRTREITWSQEHCIKVNRDAEPNLLIPKKVIKYIYKEDEVKELDQNVLYQNGG